MRPALFRHCTTKGSKINTPTTHTQNLYLRQSGTVEFFSIMPLVLFTFNVTKTEDTTQQPFITSLEKLGVVHHSPFLSPLSLSISAIVSPLPHLSVLLFSALIHS